MRDEPPLVQENVYIRTTLPTAAVAVMGVAQTEITEQMVGFRGGVWTDGVSSEKRLVVGVPNTLPWCRYSGIPAALYTANRLMGLLRQRLRDG